LTLGLKLGDCLAVNGACLTMLAIADFGFDVSTETLACITLDRLVPGRRVNLERALPLLKPAGCSTPRPRYSQTRKLKV
jgi:riboflavin synthase